ncbi:Aste57867_14721 [Aphanomyces stellatus]|uniref:Aste57867_14721 protein n=1 Tax=Aphanomyces stellatus TaxID=120398 RepID=A0A485L1F4_9STRA|nr:hypothetical protein As57867_014666 [Aphanomyces stellatus]VFT91539.1 Aste57867_14721 [Aphanomyces stellatus]
MEGAKRRKKKRCHVGVTMMDVIKALGMRVVEGTKLNLVGKGIDTISAVASTIAQGVTCLYLSQNNLTTLEGLSQFTRLKVLSLGGNLISRFDVFDPLAMHVPASLRTLLLSGNPVCDAPNYRIRMLMLLPMVQVLDGVDVSTKERDVAPFLVAQDASLRAVISENHAEISKLEWIVMLIQVHKEFYHVVFGAAGPRAALRNDHRMPQLDTMAINVTLLLRLWKAEDALQASPIQALVEMQLQRVVVRAFQHLAQHPLRKAKQLLQKFAHSSQRLKGLEPPTPPTWEEAYASVISLQQNTIARLRGLCERNRRELIDALKSLAVRRDPSDRLQQVRDEDEQRRQAMTHERELLLREYQAADQPTTRLPPQLPDPEESLRRSVARPPQLSGHCVDRQSRTGRERRQDMDEGKRDETGGDNDGRRERNAMHADSSLRTQLEFVEQRLREMDARHEEDRKLREEHALRWEKTLREASFGKSTSLPPPPPLHQISNETLPTTFTNSVDVATHDIPPRLLRTPSDSIQPRSKSYQEEAPPPPPPAESLRSKSTLARASITRPSNATLEPDTLSTSRQSILLNPRGTWHTTSRHVAPPSTARVTALWRTKLRRLFLAWRQFCLLQRRRQYLEHCRIYDRVGRVFAAWKGHCVHQSYIRAFVAVRHHRGVLSCFHKWANASRFKAIASFAAARRQRDRLARLVGCWRAWSHQAKHIRLAQTRHTYQRHWRELQLAFAAWHQLTKLQALRASHRRQLARAQAKYNMHVTFHTWKSWLERQIRPREHVEHRIAVARVRRKLSGYFVAWKQLMQVSRRHKKHTFRLVWHQWQTFVSVQRHKARLRRKTDRFVAKKYVATWLDFTDDHKHKSRARLIAARQWQTHRLRHVWAHWHQYKCMRRKFVQGCLKALKHWRIKMERRVWRAWATTTVAHLQYRNQQKTSKLQLAFQWFVHAVKKQRARHQVERRTERLEDRRALHGLQQCWTRWRVLSLQRRKPVGLIRYVEHQQRQLVQRRFWIAWRAQSQKKTAQHVRELESQLDQSHKAREDAMAQVLQLNDTSIELAEEVAHWKAVAKQKDATIETWQQSCRKAEQATATLEQKVVALQQQLADADQEARDKDRLVAEDVEQYKTEIAALEGTNDGLARRLRDSQDETLHAQQQVTREKEKSQRQAEEKRRLQQLVDQKQQECVKLTQSLQSVQDTLAVERNERHEAAVRCQDYEKRLADTVHAIHDHEAEQEHELKQTHDLALEMERRWKEQEAKNAELMKLLHEKNNQVAALTSEVQSHRSVESHRVNALLEEVQANISQQKKADKDPMRHQVDVEIHELNAHTASIHDDLKVLQQRLMLRLQQKPIAHQASPSIEILPATTKAKKAKPKQLKPRPK